MRLHTHGKINRMKPRWASLPAFWLSFGLRKEKLAPDGSHISSTFSRVAPAAWVGDSLPGHDPSPPADFCTAAAFSSKMPCLHSGICSAAGRNRHRTRRRATWLVLQTPGRWGCLNRSGPGITFMKCPRNIMKLLLLRLLSKAQRRLQDVGMLRRPRPFFFQVCLAHRWHHKITVT